MIAPDLAEAAQDARKLHDEDFNGDADLLAGFVQRAFESALNCIENLQRRVGELEKRIERMERER